MEAVNEVLIVSDSGNKDAHCTMYDISSGALIETYKDGHSVRNGMDFIGNDYLISAFKDKAKIKIWQFGQSNTVFRKMTSPGIVSALAVSKCGRYCIAGIGRATYVWEVASGNLESHMEYHSQDITCVKFSSDGSHFITGGKDGMVFVFLLTEAVILRDSAIDIPKARFTWTDHSGEITDIYVGYLGYYSRVATVSSDMTCRIYELDSGNHLCTVHVKIPLTAVTMDICECFLFLGTAEGDIYRINLFDKNQAEMHFENVGKKNIFTGHKKEITSLCVSHSGKYLVSGSADRDFRIWDLTNFSCFKRQTLPGPVTNVITSVLPPGIKNRKHLPHLVTGDFKRVVVSNEAEDPLTNITTQKLSLFHAGAPDQFFDSKVLNCTTEKLEKMMLRGNLTVDDLSQINNEMYSFALTDILHTNISSNNIYPFENSN